MTPKEKGALVLVVIGIVLLLLAYAWWRTTRNVVPTTDTPFAFHPLPSLPLQHPATQPPATTPELSETPAPSTSTASSSATTTLPTYMTPPPEAPSTPHASSQTPKLSQSTWGAVFRALPKPRTLSPASTTISSLLWQLTTGTYRPGEGGKAASLPHLAARDAAALRRYGNALGSALERFRARHSNQLTLLDTFINTPSEKTAAPVAALARDYRALAHSLSDMTIPHDAAAAHRALTQALESVAQAFASFAAVRQKKELITTAQRYNEAANELVRATLRVSRLFEAAGIRFSQGEPGRIFQFSGIPTTGAK